ncbi:hypothetical protein JHK85_019703 [Glycine max]|nr:hypothetical protein JHK85_019703 [Glycine max]
MEEWLKMQILNDRQQYREPQLLAAVKFAAHLVNQQVANEIIALELLTKPTDDSVEVAVGFVTECGSILQDLSPKGLHAVRPELDLAEQEDQITHEVSLDEEIDPEISLDIFKPDPNFLENEKCYEELKKSMLGEEFEDDEEGLDAESDDDDEDEESDEEEEEQMQIKDETETNLVNLRRTIYLTIMFSVDFEEAGHKLLKIKLEPGQEKQGSESASDDESGSSDSSDSGSASSESDSASSDESDGESDRRQRNQRRK